MTYFNNLGQGRVGWRSPSGAVTPSTLWNSIYSVWNADTLGTSLDVSIFRAYNGEVATVTPTQLSTNIFGVWNGETLGTSLDTSIHRVYNGDNVNDSSGNGQNGTNVNNVTFTTGKVGNAFTFNGSNYIQLPDNSLNLSGSFSVSLWYKTPSSISNIEYHILDNVSMNTWYNNPNGFDLIHYGNSIFFDIYNNTNTAVGVTANYTFSPSTWYHVTATKLVNGNMNVYINGVLIVTKVTTANPTYLATISKPCIGAMNVPARTPSVGYVVPNGCQIDALNVWTKELTANEVVNLYNSGNGAEYPFSTQTLPTYNDAVGSNHGTTPASTLTGGVPGPSFTTGKIGQAFNFDGVNDYVALPDNSFNSLTGDFSISFWMNLTNSHSSNSGMLFSNIQFPVGYSTYYGWQLSFYNGQIYFIVGSNTGNSTSSTRLVSNTLTSYIGNWVHVTCTHKQSTGYKIYVNGTLNNSNTGTYNPVYTTNHTPSIGAQYSVNSSPNLSYPLNGKLDALNVWNKELSADEITALYNSGNGQQYPFSSVTLSNSMLDSVNSINGTNVGGVTLTTGKVGNAFTFNGSNYISLPDNSLNSLTGDFSISCWYYVKQVNDQALISNRQVSGGNNYGWQLYYHSGWLYFYIFNGTSTYSYAHFESGFPNDTWVHITLVRKAGTSTKFYINGVLRTSYVIGNVTTNPAYTTNQKCSIGNSWIGTVFDSYVKNGGKIDGLTIWNKELSAEEVFNLYNDGTGAEYPFTSQYLASLKDSVGSNDGTRPSSTLTGGVPGPTFTTGKIGKVFNFDGINDYISLPPNTLRFTGDFSCSLWVYIPISNSSPQALISCRRIPSISTGWEIRVGNNTIYFGFGAANGFKSTSYSNNSNIGSWKHVVTTRKNGTGGKLYIDGILQGTISAVEPISYDSVDTPSIGCMNYASGPTWFVQNGLKMDAISTWNKELTSTEITELYNSGNGKQYPN